MIKLELEMTFDYVVMEYVFKGLRLIVYEGSGFLHTN